MIESGDLDDAERVLDVHESMYLSDKVKWNQNFDKYGPNNAEAMVDGVFVGKRRQFEGGLTFFRGTKDAYRNGSKAAEGYIVDLKPGMHALLGILAHESGHMDFKTNIERFVNPVTGNKGYRQRSDKEVQADKWLQFIYPNKY